MNDCERYFPLLEDLLEGELDERRAGRLSAHVAECPGCQREYDLLGREKEVFDHYLYNAEPPPDLRRNFQTRLAAEKLRTAAAAPINSPARRGSNIFRLLNFSPAAAGGGVLILLLGTGLVWLNLSHVEKDDGKYVADTKPNDPPVLQPPAGPTDRKQTADLPAAENGAGERDFVPENHRPTGKAQFLPARDNPRRGRKPSAAEIVKIRHKTASSNGGERSAAAARGDDVARPNKEERRAEEEAPARRLILEREIAWQIEKVELLLRSFRNARAAATGSLETFDVDYERLQARSLLEKNIRLRRDAESHGIVYAGELLSRVEPHLLDIANLGVNPAPDKVRDIKERVSSQNIIASLQVYNGAAVVAAR